MTTSLPIPFAVELDSLLPACALDSMSPAQLGVAYRTLRLAWSRNGSIPSDLHTLIRLAGLLEADLVHVQGLIDLAGQPEANGRAISFPILRDVLMRTRDGLDRRSRAGRAGASARWKGGAGPPDPGSGLRLMRPQCDRIPIASAIASGALCNSESSSGARRSSELSANQSAQTGARKSSTRDDRAPSAGVAVPWALDLSKLTPEQAAAESARRSAVYLQLRCVRFPGATADQEVLPGNVADAIALAPWVDEELAAFAVWETRRSVVEFSRRKPPEAFQAIGNVIAITGTQFRNRKPPRQIGLFFHQQVWESRLMAQQRQAEATAAINAKFAADVRAKAGGA